MDARKILYKVRTNLNGGVIEVEYLKKTDSSYWNTLNDRHPLHSTLYNTFENEDEAVNYLISKINGEISVLKYSVEIYEAELEAIKLKYGK